MSHPIRVAIAGLSSTAKTSWAADAHLPYLLSPHGSSHYRITALLNSSVRAAEAARAHYGLGGEEVKVYGDAEELARDEEVDLVVVCTRVDVHADSVRAALRGGNRVYVEWPLGSDLEEVRGLGLVRGEGEGEGGDMDIGGSLIGLQGRVTPIVLKMKELVEEEGGRIGKVLSSEVRGFANLGKRDELVEGLSYFAERKVGGNPVTIAYAHMIDFVHEVLGEWGEGEWDGRMQVQRRVVGLVGKEGEREREVESDVPDLVSVHGRLAGREGLDMAPDATLSVIFRTGPPFKGSPAFVWTIAGEKGEVRLTSPAGPYIFSGDAYWEEPWIDVHDYGTDEVVRVEWDWAEWQKELPIRARIVAEVYERYARWVESGRRESGIKPEDRWPRLQDGVDRMKEIDELFRQYDGKSRKD
ncbi:MAG: hypothetical protein Q9227_005672 [Pyrenula ochraceoflavens]